MDGDCMTGLRWKSLDRRGWNPALVAAACAVTLLAPVAQASAAVSTRPQAVTLSVSHGSTAGGTRVVVSGRHFLPLKAVRFGTTAAHVVGTPTSTRVVVTSPRHAVGLVDVRVVTKIGTSPQTAADRFRFVTPMVITTSSLPQVMLGATYRKTLAATGGFRARSWSATGLPAGIHCSLGGVLSGVPTTPGTSRVHLRVRDPLGDVARRTLRLVVTSATVKQVSGGEGSACAVTSFGGVLCWGSNSVGELGDGGSPGIQPASTVPVRVMSGGATQVSVGWNEACARMTTGAVKCWGNNGSGQLGNGSTPAAKPFSTVPVTVSGLSGTSSVSVGANFACAVVTAGVKCWGLNDSGQLGDGLTFAMQPESNVPVAVSGLSAGVKSVNAAAGTACALTAAGGVMCWGDNVLSQLGDGGNEAMSTTPVQVSGLTSGVASLSTGLQRGFCAVTSTHALDCWGTIYDLVDQLAFGGRSATPTARFGLSTVAQASLGSDNGCFVTTTGGVRCWGADPEGNLGNGTSGIGGSGSDSPTPVAVTGLGANVRQVASGGFVSYGSGFSCAVTTSGAVKCWGYNAFGQLGSGSTAIDSSTPVGVVGLS